MNLAKNFTLTELTKSETATRFGIDNHPTHEIIENLRGLAENVLQKVRYRFGPVTVTSGYRSQAVNKKAGGSATSDHCKGFAADFEVPGVDNKVLAEWVRDNLKFTQLILEFYTGDPESGWVHCSYNPANLKNQCLTAIKQNGKTVYLNGIT